MEYLNPHLLLGTSVLFLILAIYFYFRFRNAKKHFSATTEELLSTTEVCRNQMKKIRSLESNGGAAKSKSVSMYRNPRTDEEKSSGFDYFFLESFDSYRKAEKFTGISRSKISASVKTSSLVRHPKMMKTMVIFAPTQNELNSNEKK